MHSYDFVSYCEMLTDKARLNAYAKSLKEVISPESVVLDLGAGIGVFSFLSLELGAKHVYALEVNPLIKLLEEAAAERGFSDRLEIIEKFSTDVELEEKANALVTDIHGGFPLFESSIATIIDARERLLTADAVVIPASEKIFFAPSESGEIYERHVSRYLRDFHGFRLPSSEKFVCNRWFSARSNDERLLTAPGLFAEIEYRTVSETSYSNELNWKIDQDGVIHGLRGWFENVLVGDHEVTNSLEVEETTYSSPFFPLEREIEVDAGDLVRARINAVYEKGDYVWSWQTRVTGGNNGELKADFKQSALAAIFIDPKQSLKQHEYFVPRQNEFARIDSFALSLMDGEMPSGDIADQLLEKFPEKFRSFDDALGQVFELTRHYSD